MKRKVIALTGGIGSGKSAVAKILRDHNFDTVDCDEIVLEISRDKIVIEQVCQLLGQNSLKDGELNREYIRATVFKDEKLLDEYQAIFHTRMKSRLEQIIQASKAQAVFVEIPVLDAFQFNWDEKWNVVSEVELRIQRVTQRDKTSPQNTRDIMSRQKEYECTRTIVNNGSITELKNAICFALIESHLI